MPPQAKLPQSERYEVIALLGSGGMGKVYRAYDRKLKRSVALKFLHGADAALENRFLEEAQSQARVDHAGVCKVYEVGRIGEDPYIAMQFINGQTLGEEAARLSWREQVAALAEISQAVHAAHKLGLVHRDIKPANILIERADSIKPFITDFGLARDLATPGNTVQGTLMGTPQYMAPEQARGDHAQIDARTDVYGLGATLYDTLAGRPPFQGETNLQTLYKMMHEEPQLLRALAPALPPELESVVMKCLEKEPARRYQTARALAEDLQRVLDGEPVLARPVGPLRRGLRTVRKHKALTAALAALLVLAIPAGLRLAGEWHGARVTVAVADFDNRTGDLGLDGLSGMLITSLEQSQRLSVLTRSRMFDLLRQRGTDAANPAWRIDETLGREISQTAGAQALLLTSIRKFDDLYVIDLKILDPRTNRYAAALTEQAAGKASVPGLIDKLAAQARRVLKETSVIAPAVAEVTTTHLDAYQHYFFGEQYVDQLHFHRAVGEFEAAVAIDPEFALAWLRLAYSSMWLHNGPKAREAIERAMKLSAKLPEKERLLAQGVRASLFSQGEQAYKSYRECADRYPNEKECVFDVGDVLFHGGYFTNSVDWFEKALALDATMARAHQHLIWNYQLLGKRDQMLSAAQRYVEKVGDDESMGHLGRVQLARGEPDEARRTLRHASEMFPKSALLVADLAALDAWLFDVEGAISQAKKLTGPERPALDRMLGQLVLGGALVQGGRAREAAAALDAAAEEARAAGQDEAEAEALTGEGLVRLLYLRDAEGARKLAESARARGVPQATFGFLYPLLGDLDRYAQVLHAVGDPMAELSIEIFTHRAHGEFEQAAKGLEELSQKSPYQDFADYVLADSYLQGHDDSKAIEKLKQAQATFPAVTAPGPGFSGLFRARGEYQLGVLYERTGQPQFALESTERFLAAWKSADSDLPELKDARMRVLRLRSAGIIELR